MCFNISITHSNDSIEKQLDAEFDIDYSFKPQKHISAFTNPLIPIITSEDRKNIQLCHWGLIPAWVKDIKKANEILDECKKAKVDAIIAADTAIVQLCNEKDIEVHNYKFFINDYYFTLI